MELFEAQDRLVERLCSPQLSADPHLRALEVIAPKELADVAAIGIDTNILKALRREPTFADALFVTVQANETALIAPGQCVIEYWNNHKVFASDDWTGFKNDLSKLTRRLESEGLDGHDEKTVQQITQLVAELSDDLEESHSPEYLNKSRGLIKQLLDSATMPTVSRTRLAPLASIRLASKSPPGWADDKTKSAALGDFFSWCDFLLGVLCVEDPRRRAKFLFVTDDSKPDWRTGPSGHPALIAEFDWVCAGELSIISLGELRALLKSDARTKEDTHETDRPDPVETEVTVVPAADLREGE